MHGQSEKESKSRQEEDFGKSRGRDGKSSPPKQSERALPEDEPNTLAKILVVHLDCLGRNYYRAITIKS